MCAIFRPRLLKANILLHILFSLMLTGLKWQSPKEYQSNKTEKPWVP
jgi:hypothetical protein